MNVKIKLLKGEQWKPALGFPGYRVSSRGRVYSERRELLMSPHLGRTLVLSKDKKTKCVSVGKLIYETFKGKTDKIVHTSKAGDYSLDNLSLLGTKTPKAKS